MQIEFVGTQVLQGTVGAKLHALGIAVAKNALGGLLGLRVHGGAAEGTGIYAPSAPYAFIGVHDLGPGFLVAVDGLEGAHAHADRFLALLAYGGNGIEYAVFDGPYGPYSRSGRIALFEVGYGTCHFAYSASSAPVHVH